MGEENFTVAFTHEDTVNIEPSNRYCWDVKVYHEPIYEENSTIPTNGTTINSYYSAFSLPICEIREFS